MIKLHIFAFEIRSTAGSDLFFFFFLLIPRLTLQVQGGISKSLDSP